LKAKFQQRVDVRTIRPANLQDPQQRESFKQFIQSLDEASYEKRFGGMSRNNALVINTAGIRTHFFAYEGTTVIGHADYAEDTDYARGTVANPNMVVNAAYQGLGKGRELMQLRNKHLLQNGYRYVVGGVFVDNEAQMTRLLKAGWRETTDSIQNPDDETRYFWKAVDPRYKDIEPTPLSDQ
jgi:hypothetical protein